MNRKTCLFFIVCCFCQNAKATFEIPLEQLKGIYTWRTVREQVVTGIPFGSFGAVSVYLEGSYSSGTIQLYHDSYNEGEFWTDLHMVAQVPRGGSGVWDSWANEIDMYERGEGEFQVLLDFRYSRGYLYSNDPLYDGDIRISMMQGWIVASGDIVPDSPLLTITEALLIVPEPGSVVLLGIGVLMLRRKMR